MKIALLGTRGVPAKYGGFETAVEEIGAGLAEMGHDVVVYCRGSHPGPAVYRGMRRVVLPSMHRKALETLTHTALSGAHAARERPDVAVVFNAANAPFVALLRAAGIPTALHIDGHDGRRAKWRGVGARYYSLATRVGVRTASRIIVDSRVVQRELAAAHGIEASYIAYGARQTQGDRASVARSLATVGLEPGGYHLVVARFEPENHVLEVIKGYLASAAELPLVAVGFAGFPGDYAREISEVADGAENRGRVRLMGAIWDQQLLDGLYAGAASYLHGHSVGGTNPSLLRAMAQEAPIVAFDCPYNQETTGGSALWFDDAADVGPLIESIETAPDELIPMIERAEKRVAEDYVWGDVVDDYERLLLGMCRRSR